jgi:hypothetical protein
MRFRRSRKRTIVYLISIIMIWVMISYPLAQRNAQAQTHIIYDIIPNQREYFLGEYIYLYTKERPGFLKAPNRTLYYNVFRLGASGWDFFDGPCSKAFTTNADGEGGFVIGPVDSRYFGPTNNIDISVQIDTEYSCNFVSPPTMIARKTIYVNPYPFKFTASKAEVELGDEITFRITGARPNAPIRHRQWLNGNLLDDNFYGHYTDANGNWSETIGPYPASRAGYNMIQVIVGTTLSTESPNVGDHRSVAFRLLNGPKGSFEVIPNQAPLPPGGTHVFQIRNAPPNQPIKWSSMINGIPTGEDEHFYGSYTDAQGNWEQTLGPYTGLPTGIWVKEAHVGGRNYSQGFIIDHMPDTMPNLPDVTYSVSEVQQDPQTGDFFVDASFHLQRNIERLDQDPAFDMSARTWFREGSDNFELSGVDIGRIEIFEPLTTDGNLCAQFGPTPEPVDPKCKLCMAAEVASCTTISVAEMGHNTAEGVAITIGCAVIGAPAVIKINKRLLAILALICVGAGLAYIERGNYKERYKFIDCMCTVPGKCTQNLGPPYNCARVYVGIGAMKVMCQGRIITQ